MADARDPRDITARHRDASYGVQRTVPVGSAVTVTDVVRRNRPVTVSGPDAWKDWTPVVLSPGDRLEVAYYSNAGFRGIEVGLRLPDGSMLHGVSAGVLQALPVRA